MIMSLTVQQLLTDAKRLSNRLRDHDQSADTLISRAQDVLKQVDAMRQYQEDVENLNEVAHNRPRAQLVLGIQQENRHIRTLQQENKELRAALEEHQNALELIMSKYRNHVTRLVNTPKPDIQAINNEQLHILAEKTAKVCEMAAVMKEAVRVDEENCNLQQEVLARLVTENKGLRELLDISQKSDPSTKVRRLVPKNHKEVQTETAVPSIVEQEVTVTLPMPPQPKPPPRSPKVKADSDKIKIAEEKLDVRENLDVSSSDVTELSSGESDETGSEDESIKYDTIKKSDYRRGKAEMPDIANCNGEAGPAKSIPTSGDNTDQQPTLKLDTHKDKSEEIINVDASSDKESVVIPEKKLSPSEEVVTTLVNQLVSDSVLTKETGEQTIVEADVAVSSNKQGGGKQKGKRQSSKGSPKKGGKK